MNLGTNIKALRKSCSITQEELAEYLGVTSQAVSGWECERNAPDISLLPILSNIFGVSVDELLGVNSSKRQAVIDGIAKDAQDKFNGGKCGEAISAIRKGLAEYPNSHKLMSGLSDYLYCDAHSCCLTEDERKAKIDESAAIADALIDKCTDIGIKAEAIRLRCLIYDSEGQKNRATLLASLLPDIRKNDILLGLYEGDKLAELYKDSIIDGLSVSLHNCRMLSQCKNDSGEPLYSAEERLAICRKIVSCYEILFEDGDYNFFAQFLQYAYMDMAQIYAERKDSEETARCLEKAAEYGIMFYEYPEDAVQTSMLFRGIRYGGRVKSSPDDTGCIRGIICEMTDSRCFDFVRANDGFLRILSKLKSVGQSSVLSRQPTESPFKVSTKPF